MFNYFDYFNKGFIFGATTDKYKPYINYTWSNTFQVADKMYSKNTGNSGQDLQLFSGQGCWFNGIDMQITVPVNATIQTEIKRVNGVVGINTNTQNLTNYNVYSGSGAKVYKDLYMFNRALVSTEIEKYNNQPNQFFMDSLEDSSCILAMQMCEKNNLVRNYKNNTDYPITNYLITCRTNAQKLPYGLQTSGFKRDSNGLILSKSNFLEADGAGYSNTGWIPKWNEDFTVESVFEVSNDSEFRLNGNGFANGIFFGNNNIGKNLYVRVFGSTVIQIANTKDIVCLIFSYNWQTKEVKQYVDGVLVDTKLATETANSSVPVLLGMVSTGGTYPTIKPIRLFKVHQKALTQEEVTQNFNKYQAQGLLNE